MQTRTDERGRAREKGRMRGFRGDDRYSIWKLAHIKKDDGDEINAPADSVKFERWEYVSTRKNRPTLHPSVVCELYFCEPTVQCDAIPHDRVGLQGTLLARVESSLESVRCSQ
jgi:hypothetical protein